MSDLEPILGPPPARGAISVARLTNHWHIACRSNQLKNRPVARTILGIPLVLFRSGGKAGALLDRCPHRNAPLSLGQVESDGLRCVYHGWKFDPSGACREIPGLIGDCDARARRASAYRVIEQDGYVWVHTNPEVEPERGPYRFPLLEEPGYTNVRGEMTVQGTLHATLENILDVPHTSFLHAGLFRGGKRHEVTAVVRRGADRVEAQFIGEPRPQSLVARVLSPSGGELTHFDRFMLPAVAQVEYRLGQENHLLITQSLTPISDFQTVIHSVFNFRVRLPGWLIPPVLRPMAWRILRQDAKILKRQSEVIRSFGGEQFVSTEIDLLGPHIWLLLKQAERGEKPASDAIVEKRIQMTI